MSSSYVWFQLYCKGKPEGNPTYVETASAPFIGALAKAAKKELTPILDYAPVNNIFVYLPDTTPPFSRDKAAKPGDPVPTGTTPENPLIIVAPASQREAVGQEKGPKRPRLGFVQYFADQHRYADAFTELERRASQYRGDPKAELSGVCIPRKMKTWDAKKLQSELISKREKIRRSIDSQQNYYNRDPRVIAIRLGTGCGKTHLLLEASELLDARLVYIAYNLDQHVTLKTDTTHPRRAILLRILLNLCGASNVGSVNFVNKNINDFEDIKEEVLREWAITSLIVKSENKDIVIGVDEIMKLTQFDKKEAMMVIKTVISELGEVAYRFYKNTGRMCTVVVTSLNEEPFKTLSERKVEPWKPPSPNRRAIEFITKDYSQDNQEQSVAMTVAAAGHHYRSIAYAALAMERSSDPDPLEIFHSVSENVKPSYESDLPFLKMYVTDQCKGHDVRDANFEKHVEHYLDGNGAVPPALICAAFEIKNGDPLDQIFHWNPNSVAPDKQLEVFGANFDIFRSSHEIPVIPRTATVHIPTGQAMSNKKKEWFYGLYFHPNMETSGDALFEIKKVGVKEVVATNKVKSMDESKYFYYPNVDNHPWIDRAFVAYKYNGEGSQTDKCLVLVQDKINNDVPKTVKNLNDAADLLKSKFPNILLIVNVIGAGKSTKQKDLKYPYVLARKCEDELVKYYSSSFAPIAEFVRSRLDSRKGVPRSR